MSSVAEQEIQQPSGTGIVLRDDFQLVAADRPQLEAAHARMIAWARGSQVAVEGEIVEVGKVLEHARAQKWAVAPHDRRIKQLRRRLTFYSKIEEALRQGYVIVPNFEMNVFAIRTTKDRARGNEREGRDWNFNQRSEILPQGEGSYKNPAPFIESEQRTVPSGSDPVKTREITVMWPTEMDDQVEFPIALAKPELMQRTAQTMALKLFDEIGVAVDSTRWQGRGDPIIIGRIRNARPGRPDISFFIGWYFDPSRL